jgi:hypothetical protein
MPKFGVHTIGMTRTVSGAGIGSSMWFSWEPSSHVGIQQRITESQGVFVFSPSEIFDLETNDHVQKAISDRQMPKIEYKKIEIDDYSKCSLSSL